MRIEVEQVFRESLARQLSTLSETLHATTSTAAQEMFSAHEVELILETEKLVKELAFRLTRSPIERLAIDAE